MNVRSDRPWLRALGTGLLAGFIWSCGISFVFWLFSSSEISFVSILSIMLGYGILLFGTVGLLVELLTPVFAEDERRSPTPQTLTRRGGDPRHQST